ncbi:MAG: tetratricopeptide repeat protein [Myxococcales bacterium]|nr:tetratricopeptide repeat protein [Myxococcales bacterium]
MYDPYFEAFVAEIRGFDLGDGARLLADLDARLHMGLDGDQWLLRAVLVLQQGRFEDALECIEQGIEHGAGSSRVHYIKACVLRDTGRVGEALESLGEVREASESDGLFSAADLHHAQGIFFWKVGSREDALTQIDRALELDPGSAARWLHRGQLLAELGRVDEAVRALERALQEEQDLAEAMMERAALEATRGDAEAAAEWLDKAMRLQPGLRERAAEDPRFADLRGTAPLAERLGPPGAVDLGWLDELSTWMPALRRSPELEHLGVTWLGEAESARISEGLGELYREGPLGTIHTPATLGRSRELLAERCAVARGPSSRTREGVAESSLLFIDRMRPHEGLWLALSESIPPFLWIRVEPRPAALELALAELYPRPRRTRVEMPAVARGFLGYRSRFLVPSPYTGGLEPATMLELDRHLTINPFVESGAWGSAYDDDPWPDEIPEQPELTHKISLRQREVAEQAPGHVWTQTRRTRHSRSYLTIEVHHRDLFVVEARYQPSRHGSVVEAMNAHFGCDYPVDMPVDVVAALLGFQFDGAGDLEAQLAGTEDPEQLAGLLLVISALRHDDPGVLALYRERLEHPDATVRGTIAEIAMAYNYEVLLEEMSVREPDLELREEIEAVLDGGIPFEEHDPYEDASADEGVEVLGDDDIESAAIILGDDDLESAESGIRPRRKG